MLSLDIQLTSNRFSITGSAQRRNARYFTRAGPTRQAAYYRIFGAKLRAMRLKIPVLLLLLVSVFGRPAQSIQPAGAANVPTPSEVLGFAPGDDRKLASWSQVVDYFAQLDRASDRVNFETLGQTT